MNKFWVVRQANGNFAGLFKKQNDAENFASLQGTEANLYETSLSYREAIAEVKRICMSHTYH